MLDGCKFAMIKPARLILLKTEPQQEPYTICEPTPRKRKIGEGFTHLENMFLVRFDLVSEGSWQPVCSPSVSLLGR